MNYLKPSLQDYAWGSKSFIQDFCGEAAHELIAELWFGAHPKAPSLLNGQDFYQLIKAQPAKYLGDSQASELSFLLKVLAAEAPLSIQVHPDKTQARTGFARENEADIPLDSPQRSYKDANHKPELIMALGHFEALCGIRDYPQIIDIFVKCGIDTLFSHFPAFAKTPDLSSFTRFYEELLSARLPNLHPALQKLTPFQPYSAEIALVQRLLGFYPQDNFVIAPFIMNLLQLNAFEALYLDAAIPHAYMQGAGVEIMANSDNVLRAGLTPKYIDKKEVLRLANLKPYLPEIQIAKSHANTMHHFSVPVNDFSLSYGECTGNMQPDIQPPAILLILEGSLQLTCHQKSLPIQRGQAVYLMPKDQDLHIEGNGSFVVATGGGNTR